MGGGEDGTVTERAEELGGEGGAGLQAAGRRASGERYCLNFLKAPWGVPMHGRRKFRETHNAAWSGA